LAFSAIRDDDNEASEDAGATAAGGDSGTALARDVALVQTWVGTRGAHRTGDVLVVALVAQAKEHRL
jgi:hypothetical protein